MSDEVPTLVRCLTAKEAGRAPTSVAVLIIERKRRSGMAWLFDAAESALHSLRARARVGEHPYLSGVWAPASEELSTVTLRVVEGAVPLELTGVYVRNGPNPQLPPSGQYHLFDGDGFLVSVAFDGKEAMLTTGWVRTTRWEAEKKTGTPVLKLGDLHGLVGLGLIGVDAARTKLGLTAAADVGQTANTALAFHNRRLLALNEGDVPWSLRLLCDGAFETLAAMPHPFKTHSAHPKICSATGELLSFGYQLDKTPWLSFAVHDKDGTLVHSTAVSGLRAPVMMHDYAITATRAVFLDCPLRFDPSIMVRYDRLPFVFAPEHGARIGLLPRRAGGDEVRWFDLPSACMVFHTVGAWDDGSLVRLFACRMPAFSLDLPAASASSFDPRTVDGGSPTLYEWAVDTESGETSESAVVPLPDGCTGMDFPTSHPSLVGLPIRFCYLAMFTGLIVTGCAKVDLQARAIVGRCDFPPAACGGECVFVPRQARPEAPVESSGEDDGFLITIVSTSTASQLFVLDARTMTTATILDLPTRVPYGFHGTFVSSAKLQAAREAERGSGGSASIADFST